MAPDMTTRKPLHIGLSLAPTWLSGDAWRRPGSNIEGLYSSDFALDLARRAEAAHLDFVFRPDVSFLPMEALETGAGFASLDPTVLMAALARETSRIGLVSTVSTTFFPPYAVARQLQSLHWISNGRAGWNIVTALQGHENFGLHAMPDADERYARAAEFTDVVRRLWASFPNEALKIDRDSGRYADASLVHPIDHEGPHLKVRGPLNLPAFGGPRIPLVQAGASSTGRDFAASVADIVFAPTPDLDAALELRRDLFQQTHGRVDRGRKLASIKAMVGLDLTDWPADRPITAADLPPPVATPSSRTHAGLLRRLMERESLRIDELLQRPEILSAAHWQVVGTVDDAVAQITQWSAAGAIDGFLAAPGGSVDSLHCVLEQLVPRLVEAGLFRSRYTGTTFMEHLDESR